MKIDMVVTFKKKILAIEQFFVIKNKKSKVFYFRVTLEPKNVKFCFGIFLSVF